MAMILYLQVITRMTTVVTAWKFLSGLTGAIATFSEGGEHLAWTNGLERTINNYGVYLSITSSTDYLALFGGGMEPCLIIFWTMKLMLMKVSRWSQLGWRKMTSFSELKIKYIETLRCRWRNALQIFSTKLWDHILNYLTLSISPEWDNENSLLMCIDRNSFCDV